MQVNAANLFLLDRANQSKTNGIFTGYARANNQRLVQLFDRTLAGSDSVRRNQAVQETMGLNPPLVTTISPTRPKVLSFEDSAFLKNYRNNMLDLQTTAARVQSGERTGETLAAIRPGRAQERNPVARENRDARGKLGATADQYTVRVEQLASGQVSQSAPLRAEDPMPTASGSLHLETSKGKFDFFMTGAGMENNREMLESFAAKLNSRDTGVTAAVAEDSEGQVSLRLENSAGERGSFAVSGTLSKRLALRTTQEAGEQEAVYTVQKNGGQEERFTSGENTVKVDDKITLKLKGEGTTEITGSNDAMEGMAEALSSLVDQFNSTLNYLNRTGENRTGVHNQIRRMVQPPVSEKSMSLIGLTSQRDGSYTFDREAFMNQARRSPSLVRGIAEDFAQGLRSDAQRGMRESSGSLLDTTDYSAQQYVRQVNTEAQMSPVNVLSTYSRNGVFNLMNFYTAGVLMNLNA